MTRYHIRISGHSKELMADLVRKHKIQVFNHGIKHNKETGYLIDAMAIPDEIQLLEKNGYSVQKLENLDEVGKARRKKWERAIGIISSSQVSLLFLLLL